VAKAEFLRPFISCRGTRNWTGSGPSVLQRKKLPPLVLLEFWLEAKKTWREPVLAPEHCWQLMEQPGAEATAPGLPWRSRLEAPRSTSDSLLQDRSPRIAAAAPALIARPSWPRGPQPRPLHFLLPVFSPTARQAAALVPPSPGGQGGVSRGGAAES